MLTQRISISAVCGYSSLSIMFLSKDSVSSRTAYGSIHVVTKVARFIRAFPSSISSSWIVSYATFAGISWGPSRRRGIDSPPRSNNGSTDSSVVRGCLAAGCFRGTGTLLRLGTARAVGRSGIAHGMRPSSTPTCSAASRPPRTGHPRSQHAKGGRNPLTTTDDELEVGSRSSTVGTQSRRRLPRSNWSGGLRFPGVSGRELNERVEAVDAVFRGGGEVAALDGEVF